MAELDYLSIKQGVAKAKAPKKKAAPRKKAAAKKPTTKAKK